MAFTYDELKTAIQQYTDNDEATFTANLPLFIRMAEERILKTVQLSLFRKSQQANLIAGNQYLNVPSDFLAPFSLSFSANPFPYGDSAYNLTLGILEAAAGTPASSVALFVTAEATPGRPLADLDNTDTVTAFDSTTINHYISWKWLGATKDASLTDAVVTYIEGTMLPYMAANQGSYSSYYNTALADSSEYLDFKDPSFLRSYTSNPSSTGAPRYYAQFDNDNFIVSPPPNAPYTIQLTYFYRPVSLTSGAGSGTTWLSQNAEMGMFYGALIEAGIFMKSEADVMQMYTARFNESLQGLKQLGEAKQTTDEYRLGKVIRQKQ
jgi:hypothetical protein